MHFYDEAHLAVRAGNGGRGSVSFHREKYMPFGGPSGGDGGDGGDVIVRAEANLTTLHEFASVKHVAAEDGVDGGKELRAGKRGENLILHVPVGTVIYRAGSREVLVDLTRVGDSIVLARGGRGGYGNAQFATAVRQAPRFAELGEPGQMIEVDFELKLVADVGIIGVPSAGKSTLIAAISNARPKIADYPFTTLVPNLGVVAHRGESFVASDVPGLIAGAHEGKGLGDAFLRHVERTAVIVHVLDLTRANPAEDYRLINRELALYAASIAAKPQVVVANKADVVDSETRALLIEDLQNQLPAGTKVFAISAAAHIGLTELLDRLLVLVRQTRATREAEDEATRLAPRVLRPAARTDRRTVTLTPVEDGYRVSSPRLDQLAVMTDATNPEAVARLYDVLRKRGVLQRLVRKGLVEGMAVYVGKHRLEYLGV